MHSNCPIIIHLYAIIVCKYQQNNSDCIQSLGIQGSSRCVDRSWHIVKTHVCLSVHVIHIQM